jgi:hypothetical protein
MTVLPSELSESDMDIIQKHTRNSEYPKRLASSYQNLSVRPEKPEGRIKK